ncbi:hypothetical protein FQZ97_1087600 [compost metagenome]
MTSKRAPVMKCGMVNATLSRRAALLVVEPHSMWTLPCATMSMRLAGVTCTYSTANALRPIFC